jgi:benzodiazapine receptor
MVNVYEIFGNAILYLTIGSLVTYNVDIRNAYETSFKRPPLSPPSWLFGVAWSILYVLIAIGSAYITTDYLYLLNGIQLALNFSWTIMFFGLKQKTISAIFILLMIFLTLTIIIVDRPAGYFFIPYILWLAFALYLNMTTEINPN